MVLLGCRPKGRSIEQHDMFFGIAPSLKELIPAMIASWPEAKGKMHIDAWREVNFVGGHKVSVVPAGVTTENQLFFINLGGYKPGDFEEYHYKMLAAGPDMAAALKQAKATAFYKHTGFKGAASHVDDKYGVDVDDVFIVHDLLPEGSREFVIQVEAGFTQEDDEMHLGYLKLEKI